MAGLSRKLWRSATAALPVWLMAALTAQASTTSSTGLPWDSPIQKLTADLTGPVAYGFAIVGLIVLGARWIFGHELGHGAKMLMNLIIGVGLLAGASGVLSTLFGLSGALVR